MVAYGGLTCGTCKACREGRDNLCENIGGIMGFHVDGFARDLLNMPARLVIPIPPQVSFRDAACAPVAFATVQHMLFDNAKLEPGETILVQAGGSGIGTAAIKMAKAIGCTVITTVGDDEKAAKAKALGADHVINYRTERFEGVVRKLTAKKGVDVAFEHVGPDTFNGSLLWLKRGGRLVTCGSTSGQSTNLNLFQLYLQQYRIFGSFGASMRNIRESLAKMARRPLAGDRHRSRARRFRARAGPARKPAGVWQNHRHVLMAARRFKLLRVAAWRFKIMLDATIGATAVGMLQAAKRMDRRRSANFAGALMRKVGPLLHEHRIGRDNLRAAFPEKSDAEIETILAGVWDNLGRVAAEFAHLDEFQIEGLGAVHGGHRSPVAGDAGALPRASRRRRSRLIGFACHLANWEISALAAKMYGAKSAVLYRRPNIAAVSDVVTRLREPLMGNWSRPASKRRCGSRGFCNPASMSGCWSISTTPRASGDLLRPDAASPIRWSRSSPGRPNVRSTACAWCDCPTATASGAR